jgi:hypothetical protein
MTIKLKLLELQQKLRSEEPTENLKEGETNFGYKKMVQLERQKKIKGGLKKIHKRMKEAGERMAEAEEQKDEKTEAEKKKERLERLDNFSFFDDQKGSFNDLILIIIIVPTLLFSMLIGWTILDEWNNAAVTSESGSQSTAKFVNEGKTAIELYDGTVIFVVVSIIIGAAILATQIRTHPVFIVPGFLTIAIIIFVGAQMGNVTQDVFTASQFSAAANQFNIYNEIIGNLPIILLVGAAVIAYALYAKPFGSGETTI